MPLPTESKWDPFLFKMLTGRSCLSNLLPRDGNFDKSFKLSKLGRGKVQQLGSYIKKVHSSAAGRAGFICAFVLAGGFKALLAGGAGG